MEDRTPSSSGETAEEMDRRDRDRQDRQKKQKLDSNTRVKVAVIDEIQIKQLCTLGLFFNKLHFPQLLRQNNSIQLDRHLILGSKSSVLSREHTLLYFSTSKASWI